MNFCTLFDSMYLSKGLIMYESIKEKTDDFHIYIFAFDDLAYRILFSLKLDHATIISLKEFENQDLINVKNTRTKAEYCWTSTSSVIDYVLGNFKVESCTYLDADLCFYDSPEILLDEMPAGKSVLITEHRFSKFARIFEQKRAGRFCVQFITFTNAKESRDILKKWISQCIDWCYSRYEDGKFGDQKYLENWPDEYQNIHILEHPGGGVAPWNVRQFKFMQEGNKIFGIVPKTKTKFKLIFFHFHFVRILSDGNADLGWNRLQKNVIDLIYFPYIQKIIEKERFLENLFPEYKTGYPLGVPQGILETVKHLFKKITRFNLTKGTAI